MGTALSEAMIPVVAFVAFVLTGGNFSGDIGVGAMLERRS